MKKLHSAMISAASLPIFLAAMPAVAVANPVKDTSKVAICHRTDSVTNPYTSNTVSSSSVDGDSGNDKGQGDHLLEHQGPVFQSGFTHNDTWGDIIPPFDTDGNSYDSPQTSLNWDAAGQAIWNNSCNPVTTTGGGQGGGGGSVTPPSGGQVLGTTTSVTNQPAAVLANTGQNTIPSILAGLAVLVMTGAVTYKYKKS
jgi:LPXTG-motif cell wall-anchored protein